MAFNALGSAIDDSFEPNFFSYQPSEPERDDSQSYYNGPRSGHWSVSSSVGSAIDDRCPTIWGTNDVRDGGSRGTGAPKKAFDGGLLKRLGRATVEQNVAVAIEAQEKADLPMVEREASETSGLEAEPVASRRGFYIPQRIGEKDVKTGPSPKDGIVAKALQPVTAKNRAEVAPAPTAQRSARREREELTGASRPAPQVRTVRIKSKDGREAVVKMPQLPQTSCSPAVAAASVKPPKKTKWKEHETEESIQRAKDARIAAEVLMSGAIPAPRQHSPQVDKAEREKKELQQKKAHQSAPIKRETSPPKPTVESIRGSAKGSAVGFGGLFEPEAVAAPVHSTKTVTVESLREAVCSISVNSWKIATPAAHTSPVPSAGREEVGADVEWAQHAPDVDGKGPAAGSSQSKPPLAARSQRSGAEHSFQGFAAWPEPESAQSCPPSQAPKGNVPSRKSGKPGGTDSPTIFAGKGWITPHPLSCAPSPFASPPQSHINLQEGEDDVMTYEDWKAMQNVQSSKRQHRNYSRTESVVSKKVHDLAASIVRNTGEASARAGAVDRGEYHKASLSSDRGDQHGAVSARSLKESMKASSEHSDQQSAKWKTVPQKTTKGDDRGGNSQLKSSPNHRSTWSANGSKVYEKQLNDIVEQHQSNTRVGRSHTASRPSSQGQDVQLGMPWDRSRSSTSRAKSASSFQQSKTVDPDPPCSPVNNIPKPSSSSSSRGWGSGEQQPAAWREASEPAIAAPSPQRRRRTWEEPWAGSGDQGSRESWGSRSGRRSAVSRDGLSELGRAEQGHAGWNGDW
ncbi:hypothetical protein B0A50_03538 [Salinomyces thailandicus]|uniref:Uncharacterized protein n=1 Tax=Salinomyces thailandicus TaxID=706561 RepID=A0A4U0U5T4_9PEZI|nr:hypothetical protein B0A50_03538 [Salinomyces thailandica]